MLGFDRRATQKAKSRVFRVEPENTVNVQNLKNMKKMEEAGFLWFKEFKPNAVQNQKKQ